MSFSTFFVLHLTVPEISTLEQQHSSDLHTVSLNKLVSVQSIDKYRKLNRTGPPQVIWYKISMNVMKMASQMVKLQDSTLILSSWVKSAADFSSARQSCSTPVLVTLEQIYNEIWDPLLEDFIWLGVSIANAEITFMQLDDVVLKSGDEGDGNLMKRELSLMSVMFSERGVKPKQDWVEPRLRQIQEYRQLHEAAAAASAMLKIAKKMNLHGNFTEIATLSQLVRVYVI